MLHRVQVLFYKGYTKKAFTEGFSQEVRLLACS